VYGEIPKGYEIDHIDRNRHNNYPENLRLVTKSENNQNKDIKGEKNGFAKLKEREVREILELVLTHAMTKQEIADKYRVSFATIKAIRSGRNWLSFTRDIFEQHGIHK
jgi:DNA-directed RNA polymerase specialized sigma subunit